MTLQPMLTIDPDVPETAYVPISPVAVVSLILGLLSVLCLAHAAFFVIPLTGTLLGLWALWKVRRSAGQGGGGRLALIGLILAAGVLITAGSLRAYQAATEVEPGYTIINFDLFRTYNGGPQVPPELAALNGKK